MSLSRNLWHRLLLVARLHIFSRTLITLSTDKFFKLELVETRQGKIACATILAIVATPATAAHPWPREETN